MASPLQLLPDAVAMQEPEHVVVRKQLLGGTDSGLALSSFWAGACSLVRWFFICREKGSPLGQRPRIGQGRAFAAFPGCRARTARWVEPSVDSVPSEMVFADTIRIAISDLDYWDAYVSPPLGSCPGSAGSVPRNTRPERGLRAFSSCSALYLTWRFPRSVCL